MTVTTHGADQGLHSFYRALDFQNDGRRAAAPGLGRHWNIVDEAGAAEPGGSEQAHRIALGMEFGQRVGIARFDIIDPEIRLRQGAGCCRRRVCRRRSVVDGGSRGFELLVNQGARALSSRLR